MQETTSDLEFLVAALLLVQALLIAWAIYPFLVGRKPTRRH
ncbi:hypothetical protein [Aeromicrobium sp.]